MKAVVTTDCSAMSVYKKKIHPAVAQRMDENDTSIEQDGQGAGPKERS